MNSLLTITTAVLLASASLTLSQFAGYVQIEGKRCTGGSFITSSWSVDDCLRDCNAAGEACGGINFIKQTGQCAARGRLCQQIDDENAYFYAKSQNQAPAAAPSVAPIEVSNNNAEPDYREVKGKRCVGGDRVGLPSTVLSVCIRQCEMEPCTGVNVNVDGSCVARNGCTQIDDDGATFYVKGSTAVRGQMNPKPATTTTTSTEAPRKPQSAASKFEIQRGKRCVGGDRVGQPAQDQNDCLTTCSNAMGGCTGVNVNTDGSCVARFQCSLIDDDGSTFHKAIQGDKVIDRHAEPAPSSRPSQQGYVEKLATRCAGGRSSNVGTSSGLENCKRLCSEKPECRGFNFFENNCVLRSEGCEESPAGDGFNYYQKA